MMTRLPAFLLGIPFLLVLLGTPLHSQQDDRFPEYDNTVEVDNHFKSKPEFFRFKTIADLPADLTWQNGMEHPEYSDPAAQKGGTIRFFLPSFPPSLRTVGPNANNGFRSEHWDDIYVTQTMLHPNVDNAWIPGLAREWAVAADKQTCYYKLDPEARFSNGEPVRADDFFMMFYIMQSPYIEDPWYNNHYTTKYAAITKYDDLTFSLTLPDPRPDPLYWCALVPFCKKFYREFGPDYNRRYNWRAYPSTGAYELDTETMIKGRKIQLRRVKDWFLKDRKYYRNRFNADYVSYTVYLNLDKAFEAFRKGELDYFFVDQPLYWYDKMDIPEFHRGYIQKAQFYNDYPRPSWGVYLNSAVPKLDDIRIRRGIMHSLNIQKLIEVDMRGDYDRLRTSADGYGIFTNKEIVPREYSVEKARAEFSSAGYDKLGSDGILANAAGEKLSFKFLTRDDPIRRRYALRLKEEALKCGLEFRVEAMDNTSAFKQLRDKRHELTYTAWASSPPYPRYWENFHGVNAFEKNPDGSIATEPNGTKKTKPNTNNITSTANPELDKLIDQFEKAQTLEDVERLAKACEKMVFDEAAVMPSAAPASHRTAYWRWIRWPQHYNVKVSEYATTHHLHWIDQGLKEETLEARRSKQSFPPVETIYDQYRQKN